jgi:UDP-glucose 4-epimerase
MRILMTGATSFVGRHLLPMLAEHEIFAISRGKVAGLEQGGNVSWIAGDLSQGLNIATLPAKVDAIIHLAQSDRYREFPAGAADLFRVNVEVPAALMRWAGAAGVSRAVFASTGTVYEPFSGPLHEAAAVAPSGYYGASKLACETLTLPYQSDRLSVAHLRLFFIYGPGQGNSMLARVMGNVARGAAVTLPEGSDGIVFVPTYVTDVARSLALACTDGWRGIWNVANPTAVSMREFVDAVGRVTESPPRIERVPQAVSKPMVPELGKLQRVMDLHSFVGLEPGVRLTLAA